MINEETKQKTIKPITEELIFLFNENKLRILSELYVCESTNCGCDLVEKLGISKDLLSYHIRTLRERGYIEEIRCGRRKNYVISQTKLSLVSDVLRLTHLIGK